MKLKHTEQESITEPKRKYSATNERKSKFQNHSIFLKTAFEGFIELDADVEVCGLWIDDEIISQLISSPLSDDEEEVNVLELSLSITAPQAKNAVPVL